MPDYDAMLMRLDRAQAEIKLGIESLHPLTKLTQLESYVLGHFRCIEGNITQARDAVLKTRAVRQRLKPEDKDSNPAP